MTQSTFMAHPGKEGDLYVALCPEFDVASQGATVEEATANLKEAVEFFLESVAATIIELPLKHRRSLREAALLKGNFTPQQRIVLANELLFRARRPQARYQKSTNSSLIAALRVRPDLRGTLTSSLLIAFKESN